VKALVEEVYELGINAHIVPDTFDLLFRQVKFENVGSFTLLRLFQPTLDGWERLLKRIEDLLLASGFLVAFSPVMVVIAVAIKLDSPGPVIYRQRVLGEHGKPITVYKFRSMHHNADDSVHRKYLKRYVKENNPADEEKGVYKLTNDERITRVGRFIRKYSLDETPQLWSVLKGSLSLIGPRPPLSYEYENYDDFHKKRLIIKPGITGLWQVSGKSHLSFEQMVALDLRYINEWSIWLDLKILLWTIPLVFGGRNY
jgi:exopolysaccharide biosynthesis polyprenyl glycosylphosphotransferase